MEKNNKTEARDDKKFHLRVTENFLDIEPIKGSQKKTIIYWNKNNCQRDAT